MSVFATEGQYAKLSGLIKRLGHPEFVQFHNELVVVNNAGTPTLVIGTVLGKVTATGKYKVAVQSAVDGSQVPAAIYIGTGFGASDPTTLVNNTDATVLTLARGLAVVAKEALFLDATYNDAAKKQAAYDALKAVGIFAEASV